MTAAPGRPLRFFALLMLGWIALRLAGPDGDLPLGPIEAPLAGTPAAAAAPVVPPARATPVAHAVVRSKRALTVTPHPGPLPTMAAPVPGDTDGTAGGTARPITPMSLAFAPPRYAPAQDHPAPFTPTAPLPPVLAPPSAERPSASRNRWHGGAWLLWRADGAVGEQAVPAGRLGGSQAGLRIDLDLTPHARSRATAFARVTTALQRPLAQEAAIGVAYQPSRAVPISIAAERRVALGDGGRNANALMVFGGFGPVAVLPGLRADAYGQAGIVGFRRTDAFIDGKLSLAAPVPGTIVELGGAVSGGAQPGAARLDIGPEARLHLPLPHRNARLSLEWRHRIAGDARPDSGLALTLAADF